MGILEKFNKLCMRRKQDKCKKVPSSKEEVGEGKSKGIYPLKNQGADTKKEEVGEGKSKGVDPLQSQEYIEEACNENKSDLDTQTVLVITEWPELGLIEI